MHSLHLSGTDDIKDIFSIFWIDDIFILLHYIQFKYIHQCLLIDPDVDNIINGNIWFVAPSWICLKI